MRSAIYEQIKFTGKLPSPSGVALELLRLADDPATTIDQITLAVLADPAIASKMLKLVNSPLAGAARTVASVSMAIRLLGMGTVKNLALGFTLLSANRNGYSKVFNFEKFWRESLARAVAARNLADHFEGCAPDEAFTIALLSRIGRLALATVFPNDYDGVLERSRADQDLKLLELERAAFGIDQNELSAEMLSDWGLADLFGEAVRQQDAVVHIPRQGDTRFVKIAGLLHLAQAVASVLADESVYQEDLIALMRTAERMGFESADFTRRFDLLNKEWPLVAPIFSIQGKAAPSLRESHSRASRQHRRILVVDDDPSMLRLHTKFLSDSGYEVWTATNGIEAFHLIHTEGLQLVVTDWKMPEMDGLELCQAVRESDGAGFVYIIILTAQADSDSLAKAFEAGADDFLAKPCKKEELLPRLKAGVRALTYEANVASHQRNLHLNNAELSTLNDKLHQMATTDELTALYNRREAMRRLEELWSAGERRRQPLACMMLDIDHFKACNDTYGHDAGDTVLRETARVLMRSARKGEAVFRLGGEEFLVVCPDATAEMASVGAERIRTAVAANQITLGNTSLSITISIGVAGRGINTENKDALLKLADEALYKAKQSGRNRVCIAGAMASTIPGRIPPSTVGQPSSPESSDDQNHRPTVLIVDDDESTRRLFRKLLERDGFNVVEASDGSAAITNAIELVPNVIVMDVDMPIMDGIECTRQIKRNPALNGCPIIMVSGQTDNEHIERGLQAGAEEYVAKPVRHNEFVLRVRSMCQLQQGKAELLQGNAVRGEQARAMTVLFELSRSLADAQSLDQIVTATIEATADLMNSGRISLMLPDNTGKNLIVSGAIGISKKLAATIRVPVGRAIAGSVFASGNPVVCNEPCDVSKSIDRYESDFFASVPLASRALTVPNKVVGVLNVTERYDRRPFTPHEIEYLDLVCNMAASSLEQFRAGEARERAHAAIVVGLAKLADHRDADTGKHLERVTQFALMLARELRRIGHHSAIIDDRFLDDLERAMPLHDIGKVSIPDSILLKPGALTDAEFSVMKRHTVVGANAIRSVIQKAPDIKFLAMARDIAQSHHERFDGSGYPCGLRGDQIPLAARIASVADVYDALRTKRTYKDAFPHDRAVDIIRESSGSQFDPRIVDAFLSRDEEFADLAAQLEDKSDAGCSPADRGRTQPFENARFPAATAPAASH